MIEQLMRAGLSRNEASTYLTCLRLDQASAAQIAANSDLPRATAYDLLRKLEKLRLVSAYKVNKRLHFKPNDPERLVQTLEERKESLAWLLPKIRQLKTTVDPKLTVENYEGGAAIRKLLDKLLEQPGEWLVAGSLRSTLDAIDYPFEQFTAKRVKNNISLRQVTGDGSELGPDTDAPLTQIQYAPAFRDIKAVKLVLKDSVCTIMLQEPWAINVRSKVHAATARIMLDHFWPEIDNSDTSS